MSIEDFTADLIQSSPKWPFFVKCWCSFGHFLRNTRKGPIIIVWLSLLITRLQKHRSKYTLTVQTNSHKTSNISQRKTSLRTHHRHLLSVLLWAINWTVQPANENSNWPLTECSMINLWVLCRILSTMALERYITVGFAVVNQRWRESSNKHRPFSRALWDILFHIYTLERAECKLSQYGILFLGVFGSGRNPFILAIYRLHMPLRTHLYPHPFGHLVGRDPQSTENRSFGKCETNKLTLEYYYQTETKQDKAGR